jgi:hypothetical protein
VYNAGRAAKAALLAFSFFNNPSIIISPNASICFTAKRERTYSTD